MSRFVSQDARAVLRGLQNVSEEVLKQSRQDMQHSTVVSLLRQAARSLQASADARAASTSFAAGTDHTETPTPAPSSPFPPSSSPSLQQQQQQQQQQKQQQQQAPPPQAQKPVQPPPLPPVPTPSATSLPTQPPMPTPLPSPPQPQPSPRTPQPADAKPMLELKSEQMEDETTLPPKTYLKSTARERPVPSTRIGRAWAFGTLGVSLGLGALSEMSRRAIGGSKSAGAGDSAFLTEKNMEKVVATLCKVRGAALKLGQMISIQDSLPPMLTDIFDRVRQSADFMPQKQLQKCLVRELGEDWRDKIKEFDPKPIAAASIGQVHRVTLLDGSEAAMKIQYPGVAESIDSDIANLEMILSVSGLVPQGLFIQNVLNSARTELGWECDYVREAECASKFAKLLRNDPHLYVPFVHKSLSTKKIITFEMVDGVPIEKTSHLSQASRNKIATSLLRLTLREVFEFRFMQTDPNFGNFLYDERLDRINLLDFGASRAYDAHFIDHYIEIYRAAVRQDDAKLLHHSIELGFLTGKEDPAMAQAHCRAVTALARPFRTAGEFDFSAQDVSHEVRGLIPIMLKHRVVPPPQETYSLHRKMSGAFLLCTKLGAKVNCKEIFDQVSAGYPYQATV